MHIEFEPGTGRPNVGPCYADGMCHANVMKPSVVARSSGLMAHRRLSRRYLLRFTRTTPMLKRIVAAFAAFLLGVFFHAASAGTLQASAPTQIPVTVVEFYNAALDHYFITADSTEANALDTGIHVGWTRTGYQFTAYSTTSMGAQVSSVCRFYGLPEAGLDSHFYTGSLDECAAVFTTFAASWKLESGNVFRVQMPVFSTGACPAGSSPVYRLFNNRLDANHRYTADVAVKNAMVARGYTSEGYGPDGVAFCANGASSMPTTPTPATSPIVSILATLVTPDTFDFSSAAIPSSAASAIISYAWGFGDGATATGSTASHTFAASGTFPVVLTVTDNKGQSATTTKSVTAAKPTTSTPTTPTPPPTLTPPTATPSGYVGPSNVPDKWSLELTDYASLTRQAGYSLTGNPPGTYHFTYNPEWGVDALGIKYLRATTDPNAYGQFGAGASLFEWYMPLSNALTGGKVGDEFESIHVRYLLWIEDDVAPNFNELGMKLPGISSETGFGERGGVMSWRLWHTPPQGDGTFRLNSYRYDYETGAGYPQLDKYQTNVDLKPGRWHVFEVAVTLNTVVNGVPQADGYGAVWHDGTKVFETTTHKFRNDPLTKLRSFDVIVYHGGMTAPKGPMHYRIAKLAVSTSYIGVPSELLTGIQLLSSLPLWRGAMTKGVIAPIPNTANLAGDVPTSSPAVYPTRWGKNGYDTDTWSGFAASDTEWWGVAMGGHNGQWSNKAFKLDLTQDAPQWSLVSPGTAELNYDPSSGSALVPSAKEMDGGQFATGQDLNYYKDGLPAARHTYYANHFIKARNRVFMFYDGASYGALSHASDVVDAFDIVAKKYDPAGSWQRSGLYAGLGSGARTPSCAKHPLTEDVYCANNGLWRKWTQATATWSDIAPTGLTYAYWQSRASFIDATRNRWCAAVNGSLQCIDLATLTATTTQFSDASCAVDLSIAMNGGGAAVHETDGDRYLFFIGDKAASIPGRIYGVDPATGSAVLSS